MLRLAVAFLALAALAAAFGLYGIAGYPWGRAGIFVGIFLALAVLSLLSGYARRVRA
jgi:uncharacterized membrane protein YtjA (UPF0391 family)